MTCTVCGRKLSNPKSMELGYGPVCYLRAFGSPKKAKKTKTATSRTMAGCPCCDIPGQMKLEDYLVDL